jgi:cobalamin biosynthesis protein CbiG
MTTTSKAPPILIGLGCSSTAQVEEITGLIDSCLSEAGCDSRQILAFATHVRKRDSLALAAVAACYDVPLRFLDDDDLAHGVPGTCEAVAAAAGPLLLGKRKSAHATCAIAGTAPGFDVASFGQPASSSAIMASSTLLTSWAGP